MTSYRHALKVIAIQNHCSCGVMSNFVFPLATIGHHKQYVTSALTGTSCKYMLVDANESRKGGAIGTNLWPPMTPSGVSSVMYGYKMYSEFHSVSDLVTHHFTECR